MLNKILNWWFNLRHRALIQWAKDLQKKVDKHYLNAILIIVNDSKDKKKMSKTIKIPCAVCNKEFKPKNYWQKFCGVKCKMLGWAKKQLQELGYTINK